MDKKQSLLTLIKYSHFISSEAKNRLLEYLPNMSEDEVFEVGRFLATEKKQSIESTEKFLSQVIQALNNSNYKK